MSGELGNHYVCDLCPRLRPKQPRALGLGWIDGFWACAHCATLYWHELSAGGRAHVA